MYVCDIRLPIDMYCARSMIVGLLNIYDIMNLLFTFLFVAALMSKSNVSVGISAEVLLFTQKENNISRNYA